jgi:anti-anti-sigma regulatory factor
MNKLRLESRVRDSSAVVYLDGYLNESGGELLEQECRSLLSRGCRALQLDFGRASMVNSIGISYLLDVIESARQGDARLEFVSVPEDIRLLFDLLGITGRVPVLKP